LSARADFRDQHQSTQGSTSCLTFRRFEDSPTSIAYGGSVPANSVNFKGSLSLSITTAAHRGTNPTRSK
jgi:hypothetical protein